MYLVLFILNDITKMLCVRNFDEGLFRIKSRHDNTVDYKIQPTYEQQSFINHLKSRQQNCW